MLSAMLVLSSVGAQDASVREADDLSARVAVLFEQGHYNEAVPFAQRVLAIREQALGSQHPQTAVSLNNLAELYRLTGDYAKAEPLYRRALEISEKIVGPEDPGIAIPVSNLGLLYVATGAYTRAEPLLERALKIRERILGPENGQTAVSLNNLAELYRITGAYQKAEALHLRALAINEKVYGPEHPATANSLNNLALLYDATGEYAKAEPLYTRALAIREKTLGAQHPTTAESRNNLGDFYRTTGAYAKAEALYEQALATNMKVLGPEHPATATSLNNLAYLYYDMGAYAKVEPLLQRALTIREKVLGPEHPDTVISLNNLAELYRTTGAYAKAKPLYERALAINEKTLGAADESVTVLLNNMGLLYYNSGEYAKAEPLFTRSLAIREKVLGLAHPDTARELLNLAQLYVATGAYARAEPLYMRALAIYEKSRGPEHPETATALNNLAELYRLTGAYAKAEPLYLRALAIDEKVRGPEHPDTAYPLNNLALLYQAMGDYAKAEPLLQRVLAISEKSLGADHPGTARSLNNLAELYFATNNMKKAKPLLLRALEIRETKLGPEHPDTARSLNNLGGLYYVNGAYDDAEVMMQRAQSIEEKSTAHLLISGSEARKQAYLLQRSGTINGHVSLSLAHPTTRSTALGLTGVLQYKGRVLDAMTDNIGSIRRSIAPQDQKLLEQLSSVASQLSVLSFRGPGKLAPETYRQQIDTLAADQERLEADLASRSLSIRTAITPITLGAVQQAIPDDAALVEFYRYKPFDPKSPQNTRWGEPRYVAYVLHHTGEPTATDLGPARRIDNLVTEFRTALSDPTTTYYTEVAAKLFELTFRPLSAAVGHSERLLLCPDGTLNLAPFAALVDEHGDYLAQHFEITYLTSGRDLLNMAAKPPARDTAVLLANPDFGRSHTGHPPVDASLEPARSGDLDRSGLVFEPLAGTAAEAKALQSLLRVDAQHLLLGDRATEAALKSLQGPRILHVATHGFFLEDRDLQMPAATGADPAVPLLRVNENPMLRSGLALAGANERRSGATDDGILTAAEAAQMNLIGTQLVVLSACETGVGAVQTAEGVYGLRRALESAGAQAQLTSLWKVSDAATQTLMLDYYRRLLKGEGRSAALRGAQRELLSSPSRNHPYYWAAFISIGDWTPLAAQ